MYGWRARLGLIIPSANTVNEPEFYRFAPEGVSVHASRMHHETASVETQSRMIDTMERCAEVLATADVDILVFGCTTGSLVEGAGYEEEIESRLSEAGGGLPAVATAASVRRALEALDAESVAVTTPYPAELDDREVAYLGDSGFDVTAIGGFAMESAAEKGGVHPETAYRHARDVDGGDADAVFVSCTNYRTFEVIRDLERDLGKPVVTSNQATLWDALRTTGVDAAGLDRLGRLFEQ